MEGEFYLCCRPFGQKIVYAINFNMVHCYFVGCISFYAKYTVFITYSFSSLVRSNLRLSLKSRKSDAIKDSSMTGTLQLDCALKTTLTGLFV